MNGGVSRAAVVFCNTGLVKVDIHQTNVQADNKLKNLDWSCSPVSEVTNERGNSTTLFITMQWPQSTLLCMFVSIYEPYQQSIYRIKTPHYKTMSAVGWVRGKWLLWRKKKRSKQERKNATSKERKRVATISQPTVRLASQDSSLNAAANEPVVCSSYHHRTRPDQQYLPFG